MRSNGLVFLCATLVLALSACKDGGNPINGDKPPCPPIEIVPPSPYDSPIWHPNGQFIGFNHTPLREIRYPYGDHCQGMYYFKGDSAGFWLINPDGTNKRRIFPYKLQAPAWSPDGGWIAFVAGAQIFKMRFTGTTFDTTSIVQLTSEGRNFFPAWSPDPGGGAGGQWIAYDSNAESPNGMNFMWIMKADGSQKRRIAYEPTQGEIRMPDWSPDGRQIGHIRYLVGTLSSEIFSMDSSGVNPGRLTHNSATDYYPKYSPDPAGGGAGGTKIAFQSNTNLWLMDADGTNAKQLTIHEIGSFFGAPFSWSPTGDKIVYVRYRSDGWTMNNGVLWLLDVGTGTATQLTFSP